MIIITYEPLVKGCRLFFVNGPGTKIAYVSRAVISGSCTEGNENGIVHIKARDRDFESFQTRWPGEKLSTRRGTVLYRLLFQLSRGNGGPL